MKISRRMKRRVGAVLRLRMAVLQACGFAPGA